jgi:ABC-type bacteriocin/lantibiotic exporter with double-glycine peptidase domain
MIGTAAALVRPWAAARKRRETRAPGLLRHLAPTLRGQRGRLLELVCYMLLNLSYGVALPLSSKYLVDSVIPARSPAGLLVFAGLLLSIFSLNTVVGMRRAFVTALVTQRVSMDLSSRIFAHLQRLSHAFYAERRVGELVARLSGDLLVIERAIAQAVGIALFLTITAAVAAAAAIALSLTLGLLLLVVVPIFAAGYLTLRSRLQQASFELQEQSGAAAAAAHEALTAHAEVKAFGAEAWVVGAHRARLTGLARTAVRLTVTGALFETSMVSATTLGQLLVLGVGGYLVMQDQLTLGTLLAFIGLLSALFQPIAALSNVVESMHKAGGALVRVNKLLDEPVSIADCPGAVTLAPLRHELRLEGVTFGYEPRRPVLHDLDLTIPAGARVAIVGPSGSGKTSLLQLLLRFRDVWAGRVLVDGHDVRDVTLRSLRSQTGVVFQDSFVFDASIRDNIALGRPGVSDAEVAAAARAARLDEYVASLPAGFDTVLGERGVRMSGGQRQRLAIARALLRDPGVLLLDEPTSALDTETEREVLSALESAAGGRTVILVTHRLALAATADRIFVLDQGRLVEQGTHAELVGTGGLYRRLHTAALRGEAAV